MKKTKIICTIGPNTCNWVTFKEMVNSGMNVARVNFSHATLEFREKVKNMVKRANKELNANIALMYDTKGPDLRTCSFEDDKVELIKENKIRIVENDVVGNKDRISLNYKGIISKLTKGQTILIDDGLYELKVVSKEKDCVTCDILNSGIIKSRRGVCIPGIDLKLPFISKEDELDIKYACKNDGDFLACSFVNTANDILEIKKLCKKYNRADMQIISKIETKVAIENLEEIVKVSDYIMIARGDLSIETGFENLPLYQKKMINLCHKYSKGVIMATQMMYSMVENIRPTNAEVNDVANAILTGCDAIMTSDETTIGKHPVETIKVMSKICESTEKIVKYNASEYMLKGTNIHNTIALCSVDATKNLDVKAIVISTLSGKTAIDVSSLRPNSIIIANTVNEKVARKLALKWGIYSKVVPMLGDTDEITKIGIESAKKILSLKKKDIAIVLGSSPKNVHTNFLKIVEI